MSSSSMSREEKLDAAKKAREEVKKLLSLAQEGSVDGLRGQVTCCDPLPPPLSTIPCGTNDSRLQPHGSFFFSGTCFVGCQEHNVLSACCVSWHDCAVSCSRCSKSARFSIYSTPISESLACVSSPTATPRFVKDYLSEQSAKEHDLTEEDVLGRCVHCYRSTHRETLSVSRRVRSSEPTPPPQPTVDDPVKNPNAECTHLS